MRALARGPGSAVLMSGPVIVSTGLEACATFVSTVYLRRSLPEAHRVPPAPAGCDPRPRNRAAGGRPDDLRLTARFRRPAPAAAHLRRAAVGPRARQVTSELGAGPQAAMTFACDGSAVLCVAVRA